MALTLSSSAFAGTVEYRFSKKDSFKPAVVKAVDIQSLDLSALGFGRLSTLKLSVQVGDQVVRDACTVMFKVDEASRFSTPEAMKSALLTSQHTFNIRITEYRWTQVGVVGWNNKYTDKVDGNYGVGPCKISYGTEATQ